MDDEGLAGGWPEEDGRLLEKLKVAMVYQKGWEFYVEPIIQNLPQGIDFVRVTNPYNPRLFSPVYIWQAFSMMRQIGRIDPDIIHIQHFFPFLGYFLLLTKRPFIITLHEAEPRNMKGGIYGKLSSWFLWRILFLASSLIGRMDRAIVLSESVKSKLLENYPDVKADIVPIGGTNFFQSDVVEECRTILFFGNIWWSKGLDLLLYSLLDSGLRDIKIVIAGAGKMPAGWSEMILFCRPFFEIDLRNYHLTQAEVSEVFNRCTLVALPYRNVSTSSVLSTAFAYGKPVVASKVGYFEEAIEDGKTGFLVEDGGYAEPIRKLIEDPELRARMKVAIAEQMKGRTWEHIAELHAETYAK